MPKTTKENIIFKKGQKVHLDDIYIIQGIGGGDWWQPDTDNPHEDCDDGEHLIIVRDIKIELKITT